ncbi:flagellar biosynthesis protein FlgJ [Burkholderia lata]|uniref:flagellar biosynthesis protein FlgJ n=1 Tax=Burkholderia lata (strain ATCC 17760 / DSM 23089 / LMG 22485 / NCIMB 9086 / R18194 / 383) TaxID=482957 RepID=UPI00399AF0F6
MTDFSRISAAPPVAGAPVRVTAVAGDSHEAKLEQVAVQFEGMFIAQMLGEMRKLADQLKTDNGFDDRSSKGMLEHAHRIVADTMAEQRAFGIADTLIAQLRQMRAQASGTAGTDRSNS